MIWRLISITTFQLQGRFTLVGLIVCIDVSGKYSEFQLLIYQMLDGHEDTLEVSTSQPGNSPAKQKTLDSFVRRCNNMDEPEKQSDPKRPRY